MKYHKSTTLTSTVDPVYFFGDMNNFISKYSWRLALLSALFAIFSACASSSASDAEQSRTPVQSLNVEFNHETFLPTSTLVFRLDQTKRLVANSAKITFDGQIGGSRQLSSTYSTNVERKGDVGNIVLKLPVRETLLKEFDQNKPTQFNGSISIELSADFGVVGRSRLSNIHLAFQPDMVPSVQQFNVGDAYPNTHIPVSGNGFLRANEGTTWAVIDKGGLEFKDRDSSVNLAGKRIALEWRGNRNKAFFPLDPTILGVQEGNFHMTLHFENELESGQTFVGQQSFQISGTLQAPYVSKVTPNRASRGQLIELSGAGFVPDAPDSQDHTMFFRYQGSFEPSGSGKRDRIAFSAQKPLEIAPNKIKNSKTAVQKIRYQVTDDRKLAGLGAVPGTFEGTITPILLGPRGQQTGQSKQLSFEIAPTKQVVYLKFLPAFSRGLQEYGLRGAENAIRDRILEVANRDYSDYNVEFRAKKPTDFADFATLELGGPDPTGGGHFGYDNSFNEVAKDTGNLHLDDYLGGINARSDREFNAPYGGIFIAEFSFFSKKLNPNNPHASKQFDRILSPFMPKLGGKPIRANEWPGGPRSDKIRRAVQMVGNVIGNTVTHELGHSLGMTYVPSDDSKPGPPFHNQVPGPFIMDAGSERPFAERAELNGQPPRFNKRNKQYLERILPKTNRSTQ